MMNLLSQIDFERAYVVASLLVAILVWVEASWVLHNKGKLPDSGTFAIISLITSSWLVASGLAMFFLQLDHLQMSVAAVYGVYCVAGWFYSAKLISLTDIDDPMDLVMPDKYLDFGRAFALVFAVLCIFVLSVPYLQVAGMFGYK